MSPLGASVAYSNRRLDQVFGGEDKELAIGLVGPGFYPEGTIVKETGTRGLYTPYTGSAGLDDALLIVRYPVRVDASNGVIWPGDFQVAARGGTPAFRAGTFDLSKIFGLDADAIDAMAAAIKDEGRLGTDQVDDVTVTNATGGTFNLTVTDGQGDVFEFDTLAYDVSAATLQALMIAAMGPAAVGVALSSGDYTLTWGGAYRNQPMVVVAADHTTGASHSVVVTSPSTTPGLKGIGIVQIG